MVFRAMITGQPYPVKAAVTVASNPLITQPNTKLVYKALKSLDLYVVMDFWMTPCADISDYVLPVASWLERPIMWDFNGYAREMAAGEAAVPAIVEGQYDHKTDYDVYRELSLRLGLGKYWPWKDIGEFYDALLKPTGMTHNQYVHRMRCEKKPAEFRKYEKVGFGTPSDKAELYSRIYEQLGYDSNPLLDIHPETAEKLSIRDGDWVWIETLRGRVKHKAKLNTRVSENVVHAEHGWWLPELPGEEPWLHGLWEVNINVVTNDDPEICDPVTGSSPLRTALCRVYKVKSY